MGSFFDLDQIASILEMLERHDVSEFKLERGDEKLSLRRGQETVTQVVTGQLVAGQQAYQPQYLAPQQGVPAYGSGGGYGQAIHGGNPPASPGWGSPAAAPAEVPGIAPRVEHANGADQSAPKASASVKEVRSPMVGTFYRRPAVDAEPYVSVGDTVKKGDVLCIVEAMKLMNEIETDIAGKIVEVSLEDGQMVEYGEVLFRIEPN